MLDASKVGALVVEGITIQSEGWEQVIPRA